MAATPKLFSFATIWMNTFNRAPKGWNLKPLDYCNDVAEGFGKMMEQGRHIWVIKCEQKEADPADWVDINARADPDFTVCRARGNDAKRGRGVDTVDFAIVVTHGAATVDFVDYKKHKGRTVRFASVFFNREPFRFCSHKTRFGDGRLKWLILDCCKSLEVEEYGFTPWVVWRQSFHGLHTIFGFTRKTTDSWLVNDRGKDFAYKIFRDYEMADAWIDSAFSWWCDDSPVAAAAGRDFKDAVNRLETERISSSFDSIPNNEVKAIQWTWRELPPAIRPIPWSATHV